MQCHWHSGFASMKEPSLINSFGVQKCGILDGRAWHILLHQHSRVRGLQTMCAITRNRWIKGIKRRCAIRNTLQTPLNFTWGKFQHLP